MIIEQPPELLRRFFPEILFRDKSAGAPLYLTFDDGPIPEATPWVIDLLDRYGIHATFFMVADNARRYPELVEEVRRRGHCIGNHTMHHIQGIHTSVDRYMADVAEADSYLRSPLFRPPHGLLKRGQIKRLSKSFRIVMHDVVTRDYSRRLDASDVVAIVKRYVRPGSIIVFHDSLKSIGKLHTALPECIEWLLSEGYGFDTLEKFAPVDI